MPSFDEKGRGLRPVINAAGTMTVIGASSVHPDASAAVADILTRFVWIDELQRVASKTIARLCGAEAGIVTASTSGAVTVSIAASMTGIDRAAIAQLPDVRGLRNQVVILQGHLLNYGAPIDQAIRLSGASVRSVGQATSSTEFELDAAFGPNTTAALYVVSHHAASYGMIPLMRFAAIAHAHGVPVIVDAAAEYDLRGFLGQGADLVLYSAHKFLRAPTAGIIAGRRDLVRACYLQNGGIGRGFKVGKEGIAGTIAALEAWERSDHAAARAREGTLIDYWIEALGNHDGLTATIVADPTGNPVDRLRVTIDPSRASITAWEMSAALSAGKPSIAVRAEDLEHGYFELDPCNLSLDEAKVVTDRLLAELETARAGDRKSTPFAEWRARQEDSIWDI
jgi:D-glucosaminate-6-phosphate ammonia-lyase